MYTANKIETFHPAYRRGYESSQRHLIFCLLITALFCLTAASNTATAATYYLDAVNGNDSNPGSSTAPWKTIAKAESSVVNGSTVYLRSGNYGEVNINSSGLGRSSWNDGVTYRADSGHNPILKKLYITGSENRYLTFQDINFVAPSDSEYVAMFYIQNSSHIRVIDCNIVGRFVRDGTGGLTGHGIWADGTSNKVNDILIEDCNVQGVDEGITFNHSMGDDIVVRDSLIHLITSTIISIGLYNNDHGPIIIENNHLHDRRKGMGGADGTHGSGIAVRASNLIIRRNIIHDFGGSGGIRFYGDVSSEYPDGYEDITIENNLIYDSQGVTNQYFGAMKEDITIRNNTFIGWYSGSSGTNKYGTVLALGAKNSGYGIPNLLIYNNVFVGAIAIKSSMPGYESYLEEDNNIFWAIGDKSTGTQVYLTVPPGNGNSIIIQPGGDADYFEGSGNFFVGGADFDTYSYTFPTTDDPILNYYGTYYSSHKQNLNDAYKLAANSPAIDFADANNAPATDILGVSRVFPPDAGCYEYIPSDPNNQAPVLDEIGDKSVDENSILTFDVNATDADGDMITYSVQNRPSGATFVGQTFSWTPSYEQSGTYPDVTFLARDIHGAQDSEKITITVNNVNRTPNISAIPTSLTKDEGETIKPAEIELATDPDGDTLTYTYSGWFTSLPHLITYEDADGSPYTLQIDVSDRTDTVSKDITIIVNNVNRAPVWSPINDWSVSANDSLDFTVSATDPDGDTIEYSVDGFLPSGAAFTNQSFSWTPSDSQVGGHEVTFIASDGQLQDTDRVIITVNAADNTAPSVTNLSPQAESIQAPLNTLVILDITDSGDGVDANSVTINVNDNIVYSGNTAKHSSTHGKCHRIGTKAHYAFIYQSNEMFDFDQPINVTAKATDLAGNVMDEYSYSFKTEMRSFGRNKRVDPHDVKKGRPVTVGDSNGDIWAAWHAGVTGSRDIYIGKLVVDEENFGSSVQLTSDAAECNPVIAVGSDGTLYVVWQDNRRGNWDIYISTSNNWSAEIRVTDSNDNQINPAIVVDSSLPNNAYIVWEDDRNGNQDIYVARSSNGFATKTVSQITSNSSDQVEPAIAVDSDNTVYVVWTDTRNGGKNDIYGAASNNGLWTNVPIVTEEESQSSPAIATEAVGSILHLVWVDDTFGHDDIFYDKTSGGLTPLTGSSIIDDTTGADQISPVIITTGSTEGDDLKVFACWRDERNNDADLYAVEIGSGAGTNVFVEDDGTNTDQSEPAIGIDGDGQPYLVWTSEKTDIYYAGSTFIEPVVLASSTVSVSSKTTVGTAPGSITNIDDVSAEVPQGAYLCDVEVTISRIKNPQKFNFERSTGVYEFGPSGMEFTKPVTITIPYEVNGSENVSYKAYWYNSLTNTLSQQGITNVETIVISSNLHALRFKTTHFSPFILGGALGGLLGGGGGGGGCSMSPNSQDSIVELLLPYIGLAVAMVVLKLQDRRKRKAHNITKSEC